MAPVSSASRRACRTGAAVDVGALDRLVEAGEQPGQLAGVRREQGGRGTRAPLEQVEATGVHDARLTRGQGVQGGAALRAAVLGVLGGVESRPDQPRLHPPDAVHGLGDGAAHEQSVGVGGPT